MRSYLRRRTRLIKPHVIVYTPNGRSIRGILHERIGDELVLMHARMLTPDGEARLEGTIVLRFDADTIVATLDRPIGQDERAEIREAI